MGMVDCAVQIKKSASENDEPKEGWETTFMRKKKKKKAQNLINVQ